MKKLRKSSSKEFNEKELNPKEKGELIRRFFAEQISNESGLSTEEIEKEVESLINRSLESIGKNSEKTAKNTPKLATPARKKNPNSDSKSLPVQTINHGIAETKAIEAIRKGLSRKNSDPRVFLPLAKFLYDKLGSFKMVAMRIGNVWDDHTIQQWVRVAQAIEQQPRIMDYLSTNPTDRTLTIAKAYRIISRFGDANESLRIIELLVGVKDYEIAEILRLHRLYPNSSIEDCKKIVLGN